MLPIKPTSDRLLVRLIEEDEITKTGLQVIRKRKQINQGEVLDRGPNCSDIPLGSTVSFYWLSNCKRLEYEGANLAVIRRENVLVFEAVQLITEKSDVA
jgi:co-chaperonin GroES (HSP10)